MQSSKKLEPLVMALQKQVGVFLMPSEKERLSRICTAKGTNPHRFLREYISQTFERYPDI